MTPLSLVISLIEPVPLKVPGPPPIAPG